MFTRTLTTLPMFVGLLTVAGLAGCKGTSCHTCSSGHGHAGSYAVSPYSNEYPHSYEYAPETSPNGYGPVREYEVIPGEQYQKQPTPAPAPSPKSTIPPSKLESSTPEGKPRPSALHRLRQDSPRNSYAYRNSDSSDPVMEPTQSERKLIPRPARTPGIFKPVGHKIRSMFDAAKQRMPKLSRTKKDKSVRETRYEVNPRQSLIHSRADTVFGSQQATVISNGTTVEEQPFAPATIGSPESRGGQDSPSTATQDPFFSSPQREQLRNQQLFRQQQSNVPAWGTHFSRQGSPSAVGSNVMSVPQGDAQIEMWPYAKQQFSQQSKSAPASGTSRNQSTSSVPPQGLGL